MLRIVFQRDEFAARWERPRQPDRDRDLRDGRLDDRRLPARHLAAVAGALMAELYVYQPFKLRNDRGAIAAQRAAASGSRGIADGSVTGRTLYTSP